MCDMCEHLSHPNKKSNMIQSPRHSMKALEHVNSCSMQLLPEALMITASFSTRKRPPPDAKTRAATGAFRGGAVPKSQQPEGEQRQAHLKCRHNDHPRLDTNGLWNLGFVADLELPMNYMYTVCI